jgi:hypothetical protein
MMSAEFEREGVSAWMTDVEESYMKERGTKRTEPQFHSLFEFSGDIARVPSMADMDISLQDFWVKLYVAPGVLLSPASTIELVTLAVDGVVVDSYKVSGFEIQKSFKKGKKDDETTLDMFIIHLVSTCVVVYRGHEDVVVTVKTDPNIVKFKTLYVKACTMYDERVNKTHPNLVHGIGHSE